MIQQHGLLVIQGAPIDADLFVPQFQVVLVLPRQLQVSSLSLTHRPQIVLEL